MQPWCSLSVVPTREARVECVERVERVFIVQRDGCVEQVDDGVDFGQIPLISLWISRRFLWINCRSGRDRVVTLERTLWTEAIGRLGLQLAPEDPPGGPSSTLPWTS